jgi:hypothetical protein
MTNPENNSPNGVSELTHTYLKQLTSKELLQHFVEISNQFTASLNSGEIDDLKKLHYYIQLIAAEIKSRDAVKV